MKQTLWLILAILLNSACSGTEDLLVDEIKYEVTLINSTTWHGSYFNQDAQIIGVSNANSNWTKTFKNTNGLSVATLNAYPDGSANNSDALMKIYVNGKVVAQGLSSISPQVWYLFPN